MIAVPRGSAPASYQLGSNEGLRVESITAHFDGAGAGSAFLPAVAIYAQSGELISRTFTSDQVAIGGTADVTFAPFLREDPAPLEVQAGGVTVASEDALDFEDTSTVDFTVTDDAANGRVKVSAVASNPGAPPVAAWTTVTKTADESVASSTVQQDDDELKFTANAGVLYELELYLIYGSPAGGGTPDIKLGMGEDNTIRGSSYGIGLTVGDLALNQALPFGLTSTISFGTAAANRLLKMYGLYYCNGAQFKLQWSQNVSNVNPTIVRAGSFLRYRTVS